jgi:hypothetical protein
MRPHRHGECQLLDRTGVVAGTHPGQTETEAGVVVVRLHLDQRREVLRRLVVAAGVEHGARQRLEDARRRGLLRSRMAEQCGCRLRVAALQQGDRPHVPVVDLARRLAAALRAL